MVKMVNVHEYFLAWMFDISAVGNHIGLKELEGERRSFNRKVSKVSTYFPIQKGSTDLVLNTISTSGKQRLPFKDPPLDCKAFSLHHVFFKGLKDAASATNLDADLLAAHHSSHEDVVP